jgi:hypothetical protein
MEFVVGQPGASVELDALEASVKAVELAHGTVEYRRVELWKALKAGEGPTTTQVEGYRMALLGHPLCDVCRAIGHAGVIRQLGQAWRCGRCKSGWATATSRRLSDTPTTRRARMRPRSSRQPSARRARWRCSPRREGRAESAMTFTFLQDFDGTLGRRDDETYASAVWWPARDGAPGQWHPWSIDPFAVTAITREQAQAIVGPDADLFAVSGPS